MEIPIIMKQIMGWFNQTIVYIPTILLVYMGISIIHFISANLYPKFCAPLTFIGAIMTPFVIVTPHCQALRWVIDWSGSQICNAWVWLGGYLVYYIGTYITPFIKKQHFNNDEQNDKEE
tara:strand:- start:9 stop:365 length:357 start_codon:yes stop_codon:yes gene_type:complete